MHNPEKLRVLEPLDRRIPDWNMHRLVKRRCPFCNGDGTPRFIRPDGLRLNHCGRCDAMFVSPAPDGQQLDEFYATYFSIHRQRELAQHKRDRLLVKEMFDLDPVNDEKASILGSLVPMTGRRVLDVGFGLGQNLLLLHKLGADVSGIDTDSDAVAFAQKHLGLRQIRQCRLADLPLEERYDLITLHDLIEHPLQPLHMLRHALRHLAPGGYLSIWTPNGMHPAADDEPIQFRVDLEHMQYLTVRTAAFLALELDMTIVHLTCTGTPRLTQLASLAGHPSPVQKTRRAIRYLFGNLPGMVRLTRLRRAMRPQPRRGTYHLFVVLQKPDRVASR